MTFKRFLERRRVTLGFVFGICFLLFSKPYSNTNFIIGIIISLIGESIRIWSSGCIMKIENLSRTGPYSLVRHPLYLGSFIMGLGLCLSIFSGEFFLRSIILLVSYLIFFIPVYFQVMQIEEQVLISKFQNEYLEYKNTVPMFFPNFKNMDLKTEFSLAKFKNNKEYKTIIGLVFIIGILIVKIKLRIN